MNLQTNGSMNITKVSLRFLVDNNYVYGVNRSYSVNYFPRENYVIKQSGFHVDHIVYGQNVYGKNTCYANDVPFDYSDKVFELFQIVPVNVE